MRIETIVITILIFAFFTTAGSLIFNEQIDKYEINVTNTEFENTEDYIHNLSKITDSMKEKLKIEEGVDIGTRDTLSFLMASAGNAVTIAWTSLGMPFVIVNDLAKVLKLDPLIGTVLMIIMMMLIIFGLIYLFFRFKPRNT